MNIKPFTKEDFDSIYLRTELEQVLIDIINNIRTTTNPINQQLESAIKGLQANFQDKNATFELYKQIQGISIQLRKLLSTKIQLENYDTISYAFYIDGKRYAPRELRPEWLSLNTSGLYVKLGRVKNDIDNELLDRQKDIIDDIRAKFQEHYKLYLNAIEGMYNNKNGIGAQGGRLNKGHVAEAYERHLQGHRPEYYNILNSLDETPVDQNLLMRAQQINIDTSAQWVKVEQESPTAAWIHIRESVGNQRGTAAADVYDRQVKETQKNSGNLRLTSLENLLKGIETYSKITNKDIPVATVAHDIALYLEDVLQVDDIDKELQAEIANRAFGSPLSDLSKSRFIRL